MNAKLSSCVLCGDLEPRVYFLSHGREFYECSVCDLLFVDPKYHISEEEEKERYSHHKNSYDDPGYREFLSKIKEPMRPFLKVGMKGLDYGCGPSDTLVKIFAEERFLMDRYDPYFAPVLLHERSYDFITATEVVEHFRAPLVELKKMCSLVRVGGWIGIMTQLRDSHRNDPTWWYLRDRTHVSFYSAKTFEWISSALNLKIHYLHQSVIVMQRS